jgi:MASE1
MYSAACSLCCWRFRPGMRRLFFRRRALPRLRCSSAAGLAFFGRFSFAPAEYLEQLFDQRIRRCAAGCSTVIALASTLQAAVGGRVLRHEIGYPAPLDNVRDVTRFFLVSPIFCLTSATLSLTGLSALGVVARSDLLLNWLSWWLGDTLGVLLVLR